VSPPVFRNLREPWNLRGPSQIYKLIPCEACQLQLDLLKLTDQPKQLERVFPRFSRARRHPRWFWNIWRVFLNAVRRWETLGYRLYFIDNLGLAPGHWEMQLVKPCFAVPGHKCVQLAGGYMIYNILNHHKSKTHDTGHYFAIPSA